MFSLVIKYISFNVECGVIEILCCCCDICPQSAMQTICK